MEFGERLTYWKVMVTTIQELMIMVNKEATTKRTRTVSHAAIPYSRGKIAEQAAAVKGKMNGAYCTAI